MSPRILVVEDEDAMRGAILAFLEDEDYTCEAVASGTEAVKRLQQQEYDLLLTDVGLPGIDGLAIVEQANQLQPDTPKIIITAHSEIKLALKALRLGAYDFIQKPFHSLEEFGAAIRRALEHRRLVLRHQGYEKTIEGMNKELARMNADLEEEVTRRTEDLGRANQELRTLDEMKNNLLANISHELRTPLVSVRGYTELFASGQLCELPGDCTRYLRTCLRNIDKLLALIESLVRYADLTRDGIELNLTDVKLDDVLRAAITRREAAARDAGLTLTAELPPTPIPVRLDRRRFDEALDHLLDNAIKFNSDSGTVRVVLDTVGARLVKLWVHDTGIGIPDDEQARIFERFYQVNGTPSRRYGGTGMGLAIARDNLRLMGCELRVTSEIDKGSTFYFTVPTTVDVAPRAMHEMPMPRAQSQAVQQK